MSATTELSGPWPPEADVPQVGFKEPADHHEAYWLYGYDPDAQDRSLPVPRRREGRRAAAARERLPAACPTAACSPRTAPDATVAARTAAGDRLRLECLEPFRRWRGRYAAPVYRLVGDEIVAGPRPGSELVEVSHRPRGHSAAAPWNTEGDWGERPPSLRYHQFYDACGIIEVSGTVHPFAGTGFRSHSRRRRDLPGFTGHAIINGRFPSGRGFGLLRYRATAAGRNAAAASSTSTACSMTPTS